MKFSRHILAALLGASVSAYAADELTVAKAALRDGEWKLAVKYAALATNEAVAAEARLVRLEAHARLGQAREMLDFIAKLEADSVDVSADAFRYWKAWASFRTDDRDAALAALEKPFVDDLWNCLGERLAANVEFAKGDRKACEGHFAKAVGFAGSDVGAKASIAVEWAKALLSFGDTAAAWKVLSEGEVLASSGDACDSARLLASTVAEALGKEAEASSLLGKIVTGGESVSEQPFVVASCRLALKVANGGETNRALEIASAAVKRAVRPDLRMEAGYLHGFLALSVEGSRAAGLEEIRALVREFPEDAKSKESQLRLSRNLAAYGDYAAALEEYRILCEVFPEMMRDASVLEGRAKCLAASGSPNEAIGFYVRAGKAAKDDVTRNRCRYGEACELVKAGRFDDALVIFRELAKSGGEYAASSYLRMAAADFAAGRYGDAVAAYGQALADKGLSRGDRAVALAGRGRAYYRLTDYSHADGDFAEASKLDASARDELAFLRALCTYASGSEKAARDAIGAIAANTKNEMVALDATRWIAKWNYFHGELVRSEESFVKCAENPLSGELRRSDYAWAAKAAFSRADYLKTISYVTSAMSFGEDDVSLVPVLAIQGEALMELARYDEAILVFEKVLRRSRDEKLSLRVSVLSADCLFAMGADNRRRYDDALASYRVLASGGALSPSERIAVSFKIGRVLEKSGRIDEAMDQYYSKVLIAYGDGVSKGERFDDTAKSLFARAGFLLAGLHEAKGEPGPAVRILKIVASAGLSSSNEARRRMEKLMRKGGIE